MYTLAYIAVGEKLKAYPVLTSMQHVTSVTTQYTLAYIAVGERFKVNPVLRSMQRVATLACIAAGVKFKVTPVLKSRQRLLREAGEWPLQRASTPPLSRDIREAR